MQEEVRLFECPTKASLRVLVRELARQQASALPFLLPVRAFGVEAVEQR
jgi:hypothetical protein